MCALCSRWTFSHACFNPDNPEFLCKIQRKAVQKTIRTEPLALEVQDSSLTYAVQLQNAALQAQVLALSQQVVGMHSQLKQAENLITEVCRLACRATRPPLPVLKPLPLAR